MIRWGVFHAAIILGICTSILQADLIQPPRDCKLFSVIESGRVQFINSSGKVALVPDESHSVCGEFSEGLAPFLSNGKWGFIDEQGREVIPATLAEPSSFFEGLAAVKLRGKWGFIDRTGKIVIQPKFDETNGFWEKRAAVRVGSHWGYVDPSGRMVIDPRFDQASDFAEGLAPVRLSDTWGYIDKDGKTIIDFGYKGAWCFHDGLALVRSNGLEGFIDHSGRFVIPLKFQQAWSFSEGLAAFRTGETFGYVDRTGKIVIYPQFDSALEFKNGRAQVKSGDRWGYIDPAGKPVIPTQYDEAMPFCGQLAQVTLGGKTSYINQDGTEVSSFSLCEVCGGVPRMVGPNCMYTDKQNACGDLLPFYNLAPAVVETSQRIFEMGAALLCYYMDHQDYPPVSDIEELRTYLEPEYIFQFIDTDGWDQPWKYEYDKPAKSYKLTSAGSDMTFEKGDTKGTPLDDYSRDLVFSNGEFVKAWSSTPLKEKSLSCTLEEKTAAQANQTMETLQIVGTAIEAYRTELGSLPDKLSDLTAWYEKKSGKHLQVTDGWGSLLAYESLKSQGYRIASAGMDKELNRESWKSLGLVCSPDEDAVWENGRLVRWWP